MSVQDELDPKYDDYSAYTKGGEQPQNLNVAEGQSGHLGHLTEDQKAQVFQLRSMLESEGFTERLDTLTLLRFLRARKFDVNASKKMFVDCEAWRKEQMLDALVPTWEYKEGKELMNYYTQYYHKTDKDGRPVYVERLGKIDLNAMRKITTDQRMLDNLAIEYEKCAGLRFPACSQAAGHLVETCCTIMDLKGVNFSSLGQVYAYVKQASVISQNYYPERLGKLYLINAHWTFKWAWSQIKSWLDPVTVAKITILDSKFEKELLAQIPAENLPPRFGGTCRCAGCACDEKKPDEACDQNDHGCALSDAGPWNGSDLGFTPWYENEEVKAKALESLKGTSKDPAVTQASS